MKVCYVDHPYHSKTSSTGFFYDFLYDNSSQLVRYYDGSFDSDEHYEPIDFERIKNSYFDVIVIFQCENIAKKISGLDINSRIVFVPMFDGCRTLGNDYWESFKKNNCVIISFSSTLHTQLGSIGIRSVRVQYFPNPENVTKCQSFDKLRGFFWPRTDTPSFENISKLSSNTEFETFHVHMAQDPNYDLNIDELNIRINDGECDYSTWFEKKEDFKGVLFSSNVFFAPRAYEGIGMSFLEAMASGMCVIAPDHPTMNEYITNNVNGILYDIDSPKPLDLSRANELGKMARQGVKDGYKYWKADFCTRVRDVIFGNWNKLNKQHMEDALWKLDSLENKNLYLKKTNDLITKEVSDLKITVAVVSYNSGEVMEKTLLSIFHQDYDNLEVVVVDGQSTDNTMKIVEHYSDYIDIAVSEKDNGTYDAMNKAATLGTGDYIIFINSGDYFYASDTVSNVINSVFFNKYSYSDASKWPEFIVGNHLYLHVNGATMYQKAKCFDETWGNLKSGAFKDSWWGGIPCHQATFTKRVLLANEKYDLDFKIAADHNFMFLQKSKGAKFVHCNVTIAIYVGGGVSATDTSGLAQESFKIGSMHSPSIEIARQYYERIFGVEILDEISAEVKETILEVDKSGVFWEDWYRLKYMEEKDRNLSPAFHFITIGRHNWAKPNPFFDYKHYYIRNKDVKSKEHDALFHYIRNGLGQLRPTIEWDNELFVERFIKYIYDWRKDPITKISQNILEANPSELLEKIRNG